MTDSSTPEAPVDPSTPSGFIATARKAVTAGGAAFLAAEGGLIPVLVTDAVEHGGLNVGLLLGDLAIGIGAFLVAAAAVYQVRNAPAQSS